MPVNDRDAVAVQQYDHWHTKARGMRWVFPYLAVVVAGVAFLIRAVAS